MKEATMVEGVTARGFEPVRALFAANFARDDLYRECGAALCIYVDGRIVVDLWGGLADPDTGAPWTPDTLINVWSTTKGLAAVAAARCVDRGLFRYEDPVASVWPEFAQNGKGAVTIAQVLSHQAGLPGFVAPTATAEFEDHPMLAARLAAQAPAFPPGAANSYHAATYGVLVAEIVRRAAGKTLGALVAEEVCGPLGADFFIGLPERFEPRVARLLPPRAAAPAPPDLSAIARMALVNPELDPATPNRRSWRAAEMPAVNGQASARGVARLYAALAQDGAIDGVRILSQDALDCMTTPQTTRVDLMLGFRPDWGMGVAHNLIGVYGPNPRAFGHSGWGGSFGCADREARVAIGYVCNQMGADLVGDPRGAALCAALYRCMA
jgi:CubicO group peptidase (beta-lactamase class C family)